jgi:Rrf2 family protein
LITRYRQPTLALVKPSVKCDYAARAVLALARYYSGGGARRIEELAAEQGIPANFLGQILLELKASQIVQSQRGKRGGYRLARSPATISLGDVLRSVEGQMLDAPAITDPECPSGLRQAWRKLQSSLETVAGAINFQQLIDEDDQKAKMYYI